MKLKYTDDVEKIYHNFNSYGRLFYSNGNDIVYGVEQSVIGTHFFDTYCKYDLSQYSFPLKGWTSINVYKVLDIKFSDYVLKYYKLIVREQKLTRILDEIY